MYNLTTVSKKAARARKKAAARQKEASLRFPEEGEAVCVVEKLHGSGRVALRVVPEGRTRHVLVTGRICGRLRQGRVKYANRVVADSVVLATDIPDSETIEEAGGRVEVDIVHVYKPEEVRALQSHGVVIPPLSSYGCAVVQDLDDDDAGLVSFEGDAGALIQSSEDDEEDLDVDAI